MKALFIHRWPNSSLLNSTTVGYVVFGLLVAGTYFFISNVWTEGEQNSKEQIATYDRMRAIAAYKIKPEFNQKEDGSASTYLKQGTAAELTATIQSKLKEIAATVGAQVNSASALKTKANGPIALVGASLQMSGSMPSIYNFISKVESAKPYLFVDRVLIRSNEGPAGNLPSEPLLIVELDVYGAILSDDLIGKAESP
jgi:Type II secretion system (T2SS), protein M subtype b